MVITGVISRVTIVITQIRGLIPPLITTHEPPRRGSVAAFLTPPPGLGLPPPPPPPGEGSATSEPLEKVEAKQKQMAGLWTSCSVSWLALR